MLRFQEKAYTTKTADPGRGSSSGLPVAVSYGRSGSLSRGVSCRQLALQTGAGLDACLEEGNKAA
jgi:hypothetical protein